MTNLDKLIEAVERGEWHFQADAPARKVFPYKSSSADDLGLIAREAFGGSLDAAKALIKAIIYGWIWGRKESGAMWVARGDVIFEAQTDPYLDEARALLLCILKAYRSQVQE